MKKLFLIYSLFIFGCSSQQIQKPPLKIVVPETISPVIEGVFVDKDCAPKTWNTEWDKYIIDSLSSKESLKNFNKNEKYWVAVLKALAKAESCLNLSERYVEKGLGRDALTGAQNTSEGLLQLSYQDSKFHGCQFNWSKDKTLDVKSLDKTIFNPKLNLECGMIILNRQLEKKGVLITEETPYYWAVLNKANARYKDFKRYLSQEGF